MLIKLAWRNVWRNTRRSVLTMLAVAFGLGICIYSRAIGIGFHNQMIRDTIQVNSGHLQVHALGWQDNMTLEYTMDNAGPVIKIVESAPNVLGAAPRAQVIGLVSRKLVTASGEDDQVGEENTTFAFINGVDPEAEIKITNLPSKIREGRFVSADDPTGIIIGKELAATLGVHVGDRVLLWTTNYYESLEAKYFFVRGIFKTGYSQIDVSYVFAPINSIQKFLQLDNMVTMVAIRLKDPKYLLDVDNYLEGKLDPKVYEVMTWEEFMPEIKQYVVFDDVGAYIFLGILVAVVVSGILNTQLMAVLERTKEFGTMLALGTRPVQVALLVFYECAFMTSVGIIGGNIIGFIAAYINSKIPINLSRDAEMFEYFGIDPHLYAELALSSFIWCSLIILVLAIIFSAWPAVRAARYRPIEALRYV